jgi:MFS family permease
MPNAVTLACVVVGTIALVAYVRYALRTPHPVIELRLFRLHTFRDGVLVGSLFRIGIQSTPFLLPLLFQLGFGLDPLQSGILTCATSVGALFIKTIAIRILRRYGFRTVLVVNGALCALTVAMMALFTSATPHLLVLLLLLISGCMRSLQFTALQAITLADIGPQDLSQAASISSMLQRLAQSMGIALAAYILQAVSTWHEHATIEASDFPATFIAIALIGVVGPLLHRRLAADAGATVSGHAAR